MQKCLAPAKIGDVLSVAKLTPGQESYYERSVAAGLDDYYTGRGESPGVWAGRGAAALGLEGVVQDGQLRTLVRGLDPLTGERLRRHPKERTITIERIDPHVQRVDMCGKRSGGRTRSGECRYIGLVAGGRD